MGYLKVIDLGHVIEVYEMERIPVNPHCFEKIDSYDPLDFTLDTELTKQRNTALYQEHENLRKEKLNRKEERRAQTLRDARNRCRRLALMNFSEKDTFMTLTFADNVSQIQYADNEFKKFIKRFNYKYNRESKFLAVREFQKRGAIHYHILIDWHLPSTLDKEDLRELERNIGSSVWSHGFVKLLSLKKRQVDDKPVDNVGAYIIKYMTKDLYEERLAHNKIYLCSRKLNRPTVLIQEEAAALLKQVNIQDCKEVFSNTYSSDYLGEISYKEYNLSRI